MEINYKDAAERYEDLEKQGRLIILPCKIGDIVYRVCKKKYDVDGYGKKMRQKNIILRGKR